MRRGLVHVVFCFTLWLVGGASRAGERWSITSMGGAKVGYVRELVMRSPSAPDLLETRREMKLVFNRLGNRIVFTSEHVLRETTSGKLVSAELTDALGASPTTTSVTVLGDRLVVRSQAGGHEYQHELPIAGELLGPEGVRQLTLGRLARPGDELTCLTLVPELAAPGRITRTCTEKSVAALVVREVIEAMPARTVWLDAEGRAQRSLDGGPFGEVVTELAEREAALATVTSGADLPEEMFARTVVRANVRLPSARALQALTMRLTRTTPAGEWPDLASHDQRVLAQSPAAAVVTIERVAPPADEVFIGDADREAMREYLEPNATINSDDPAIRAIARDVIGEQEGAFAAALALRDWVSNHMTFDLGVALAPAAEVVRRRRGTCAAYAALLTALCRAAEIPARYVLGIVYLNGAWGGHAWTEVGIGTRWIPIDAALPSAGPADAARLRVGASSLQEGPGVLAAAAQRLYGQVAIEVLSYRLAGRTRDVAPGHACSRVEGNRYVNTDLDLALEKPPGWRFTEVDAVWPKEAMVSIVGEHGEQVLLVQAPLLESQPLAPQIWSALQARVTAGERREVDVGEHHALAMVGRSRSALGLGSGADLWLLVIEGTALDPWLGALEIGGGEAAH
ncbi:MAG: transglutaminase-like domain-containing protein [Planctomycetota bacterium]